MQEFASSVYDLGQFVKSLKINNCFLMYIMEVIMACSKKMDQDKYILCLHTHTIKMTHITNSIRYSQFRFVKKNDIACA